MNPNKSLLPVLATLAMSAMPVHAAITLSTVSSWPTSPDLSVITPTQAASGNTGNTIALQDNRRLTQTFQLSDPLILEKMYISVTSLAQNRDFTISIFSVADTNAGTAGPTPPSGTNLLATVSLNTGTLSTGNQFLEFSFTGADAITLAASTGTAGYAVQLNRADGTVPFNWVKYRQGSSGTDLYADGQAYSTNFSDSWAGNSDFTLAFSGTVIPEPTTALLGGLGFLMLLRRRR